MRKLIITALAGTAIAGAWAGTAAHPAAAAPLTPAQHSIVHSLPGWVHWKYATPSQGRDCSTHSHRAILLWITGGTSTSVLCPDGTSYSS